MHVHVAPGNSAPPPDGPLGDTITVIVTSKVVKSGPTLSGTVVAFAQVAVDPGYDDNPGHEGTGTVVSYSPCFAGGAGGPGELWSHRLDVQRRHDRCRRPPGGGTRSRAGLRPPRRAWSSRRPGQRSSIATTCTTAGAPPIVTCVSSPFHAATATGTSDEASGPR